MNVKQLLTNTLLTAAFLVGGGTFAWAGVGDVTTQADIDFSNAISNNAVAGTVNSMAFSGSSFELGYTSGDPATTVLGDVLRVGNGTGTVTIADAELAGTRDEVVITFDMYFGALSGKSAGIYLYDNAATPVVIGGLYISKYSGTEVINSFGVDKSLITSVGSSSAENDKIVAASNMTTFEVHLNYATGTMYLKQYTNGTLKQTTSPVDMGSTNPLKQFVVKSNYDNNNRRCWFDNLLIQTIEGDYTISSANYTINWVCGETIVKSETRTGDVSSTITLYDTDDDSFFVGETKYMYVSDDAEGKTVANDGSTVVTITVKEPAVYNYTVKAVDGSSNLLAVLASSSVYEDANSATTNIPWYVLKDGTLYYQSGTNRNTTSITEDNQVINITYAANKTNIVYYSEAENITGGTAIDLDKGSNHQGARALSNVKFTTIEAGKYRIYSRFAVGNGTAGTTYANNPFTVGEAALVYNVPAKTNTDYTSEEFIVTGSTDLYVNFSGSSISGVDYIYVQRIGDAVIDGTIASSGYSSLASAYGLDFANATGIDYAFVVSNITKDAVTLSSVDELPANSGVILKGTAGAAYSIPVKEDAAFDGTNKLHAAVTAYDCAANEVYILQGGLFHLVTAASTVPAGKAYLLASDVPNEARSLNFAFGDETGISDASPLMDHGQLILDEFYNLQGQRVQKPTKGLYIVSGKKVIIK